MRKTSRYGALALAGVNVPAAGSLTVHSSSTSSWSWVAPEMFGVKVATAELFGWLATV